MSKDSTKENYRNRVLRVVDYIWENIDADLDVNTLADIAHFSPYHFHRIYREVVRENVNATVRRLRLHRSACLLTQGTLSIEDIAKQVGYTTAEAFSRAFSKHFGESPSIYRNSNSRWQPAIKPFSQSRSYPMSYNVDIQHIYPVQLGGLPHQGDYNDIGIVFEKIFATAGSKGLLKPETRSIGIYYDDPKSNDKDALRSHACISMLADGSSSVGFEPLNVGGGEHAMLEYTGPYSGLEAAYEWLYGEWLPNSGREAADAPPFEEYLNDWKKVPASELKTIIYVPLTKA